MKKLEEIIGDYSMAASRKNDAPGNIRAGRSVIKQNTNVLTDEESEKNSYRETVRLLITRSDEKILVVTDPNDSFNIALPGGGVENGETIEDAARRELWEETGFIAGELIKVRSDVDKNVRITLFRVKSAGGKLRDSEEGLTSWVDPVELLKSKFGSYYNKVFIELGIL